MLIFIRNLKSGIFDVIRMFIYLLQNSTVICLQMLNILLIFFLTGLVIKIMNNYLVTIF